MSATASGDDDESEAKWVREVRTIVSRLQNTRLSLFSESAHALYGLQITNEAKVTRFVEILVDACISQSNILSNAYLCRQIAATIFPLRTSTDQQLLSAQYRAALELECRKLLVTAAKVEPLVFVVTLANYRTIRDVTLVEECFERCFALFTNARRYVIERSRDESYFLAEFFNNFIGAFVQLDVRDDREQRVSDYLRRVSEAHFIQSTTRAQLAIKLPQVAAEAASRENERRAFKRSEMQRQRRERERQLRERERQWRETKRRERLDLFQRQFAERSERQRVQFEALQRTWTVERAHITAENENWFRCERRRQRAERRDEIERQLFLIRTYNLNTDPPTPWPNSSSRRSSSSADQDVEKEEYRLDRQLNHMLDYEDDFLLWEPQEPMQEQEQNAVIEAEAVEAVDVDSTESDDSLLDADEQEEQQQADAVEEAAFEVEAEDEEAFGELGQAIESDVEEEVEAEAQVAEWDSNEWSESESYPSEEVQQDRIIRFAHFRRHYRARQMAWTAAEDRRREQEEAANLLEIRQCYLRMSQMWREEDAEAPICDETEEPNRRFYVVTLRRRLEDGGFVEEQYEIRGRFVMERYDEWTNELERITREHSVYAQLARDEASRRAREERRLHWNFKRYGHIDVPRHGDVWRQLLRQRRRIIRSNKTTANNNNSKTLN